MIKNLKVVLALMLVLLVASVSVIAVAAEGEDAPLLTTGINDTDVAAPETDAGLVIAADAVEKDGVVTITVALPNDADIWSGNVVLEYDAAALTIVDATGGTAAATVNKAFAANQAKASFAGAAAYANGTTVLVATFNVVEGATISADSFSLASFKLANQTTAYEAVTVAESFEKLADTVVDETTVDETTVDETTVEETTVIESIGEEPTTSAPDSGDSGIIIFAIVAVLAIGGIVLVKKRA